MKTRSLKDILVSIPMHDILVIDRYLDEHDINHYSKVECNHAHYKCLVTDSQIKSFNDWIDSLPQETFCGNEYGSRERFHMYSSYWF